MNKQAASMRFFIISSFILLIVSTFTIIGYFVFTSWRTSTEHFATEFQNNTNNNILNQIERYINMPTFINESNHTLIEDEIIDIHNKKKREIYFASVIQSFAEEVYSFSYGTETGEYYGARRNKENKIEIIENNEATNGKSRYYSTAQDLTAEELKEETGKFDPRTRNWYIIGKQIQKPVFSPIYKHFVMNDLAVSAAYPIYNKEGTLKGVLGTHITLSKINNYLTELVANKEVTAYIVEKKSGYLVANSLGRPNFEISTDGNIKRKTIEEIDNKAIILAYQQYKETLKTTFMIDSNHDKLNIQLTAYQKEGLDWLIITSIPESPFTIGIKRSIQISIIVSLIGIIMAIVIYMKSMEVVLKPIDNLIKATEKFSDGDFSQRAKIYRNDEIGRLSTAFNKMAEQLYGFIHTLEEKIKDRTIELENTIYELKNSKDNIHLLLDSTAEAIYGINMEGNCTFCNASCLKMLNYQQQDDLIGKDMHLLIHYKHADGTPFPLDECKVRDALDKVVGVHVEDEVFWRSDGTCFPVEYFSYPQYRDGKIIGAVVTFLDITERKKTEVEILYLSYRDQLTGLYNRRYFEEESMRLDVPENFPLTIVMGDMNGLKLINDSLGHTIGDEILRKIAEVLKKGCRDSDMIARLGGDEFVILLPNTDSYETEQIIQRIKEIAAKEKVGSVDLSISFGYGTKNSQEEKIQDIFKMAEDRMYKNKLFESPNMRIRAINTIISTLHSRHKQEEYHAYRVSELCKSMGKVLGFSETEIEELKTAGLLHDIGKIAIEENILSKTGKLTDNEWEEVKRHSEIGYRILSTVNNRSEMAEYVLAHHERWDGKGYPKGLKGDQIPLQARIIHIAEAYNDMTSAKNYRKTLSAEEAVVEMQKNAGSQFDPKLIAVFIEKVLGKRASH